MGAVLGTSYTSEDPDILQVNNGYTDLEKQLERRMANIESEFPAMTSISMTWRHHRP